MVTSDSDTHYQLQAECQSTWIIDRVAKLGCIQVCIACWLLLLLLLIILQCSALVTADCGQHEHASQPGRRQLLPLPAQPVWRQIAAHYLTEVGHPHPTRSTEAQAALSD